MTFEQIEAGILRAQAAAGRLLFRLFPQRDLLEPEPRESVMLFVDKNMAVHFQFLGGTITLPRLVEGCEILRVARSSAVKMAQDLQVQQTAQGILKREHDVSALW